ncbi:type II toxin-antitoxin system RelB family antitoxin [Lacicoccus qingdaonensis]|uniref:Ribbon-helix-helix protein, copG family n=1 Tax=Lacicoccus qingdaonensis TaxID=576118 RepID=A0A1G9IN30_9BACL|nr:DUF6290 family protein [Salinicoccus qingdaonensis]SDL26540.1 hypothetical protein SAMN05216216_13522 [Salinicoccus qingdaonensis]
MITTTVNISEEDYKKVKAIAAFEGMSVSKFMSQAILKQVENKLDYAAGIDVLNENNERVSREDVFSEVFSD